MQGFQRKFQWDLEDFINARSAADPDWIPSKIKVQRITLSYNGPSVVSFKEIDNPKRDYTLRIQSLPPNLTTQERFQLRISINDLCKDFDFIPSTPRETPLSGKVIEGLYDMDNDAWTAWVNKHYCTWLKATEEMLEKLYPEGSSQFLIEPEDIVCLAIQEMLSKLQETDNRNTCNMSHMMNRNLLHIVSALETCRSIAGASIYAQSIGDDESQEWESLQLTPTDHRKIEMSAIVKMIEDARPLFSPIQMKILSMIFFNHLFQHSAVNEGRDYKNITLEKIGMALGLKHSSCRATVQQHLSIGTGDDPEMTIRSKLSKAAKRLVHDDAELGPIVNFIQFVERRNSSESSKADIS